MGRAEEIVARQQRLEAARELQGRPEALELLARRLERPERGRLWDFFETFAFRSPHLARLRRIGHGLLLRDDPIDAWVEELRQLLEPVPAAPLFDPRRLGMEMALQVAERLWRSPQPTERCLRELQERHGLAALVNLRQESQASEELCRQLGLSYLYLPVEDQQNPELEQALSFLGWVSTQSSCLVHCWAGQGRTGVMVAAYRVSQGCPLEEALRLTDHEIRTRGMHPHQRDWVRDNSARFCDRAQDA